MAITGTGTWEQKTTESNSSRQNTDFFSGNLTVSNADYTAPGDNKLVFGFSALEVHITNTGGSDLVFQWLRREGETVDNDVIAGGEYRVYRNANKNGMILRHNGTPTTAQVCAV